MQDSPSTKCSTVPAEASQHSSASCVIHVLGPAQDSSNEQYAEPPTTLSQPPQAATLAGSARAASFLLNLCRKPSTAAECRICLSEGSATHELIKPCACAGTMAYAHAACLTTWVEQKGSLTCELCKQQYQEPYVQMLDLEAAAEKAVTKEKTSPGAAEVDDGNSWQSWGSLRFWLL